MRITAAVLRAFGEDPALEEVELDEPGEREVLVRMVATGVCHTDLVAIGGGMAVPLPCVLGHEGAAVVERVGAGVGALARGDHVVLSFDSCGACDTCAAGRPAYCRRFHALNGSGLRADGSTTMGAVHGSFLGQSSFATHALASERNAVRVRDDVPLERLGPLGCSVLTGAGTVLNVLAPAASLAVFGLGTVGLAAVMAATVAGCERIAGVDPDPRRRELALELGATEVRAPDGAGDLRVDAALDTVGSQAAVEAALRSLRSPGTCATVGFRGARNPVTIDQGRLVFGRTLTGVIEGDADPQALIPRLADLHADGRFPLERLITEFAFERLPEALAAARGGDAIKPVLRFA